MKPNAFHAVALAVLVATGCAQPTGLLVHPTAQVTGQSASLHLKLDLGRQVQDLVSDVATVEVSVEVAGREPILRSFNRSDWQSDSLDFSGLPSGDAKISVRGYNDQGAQMAEGATLVPLLIGRRTLAQVYLGVSSEGRSDRLPFAPIETGTYSVDPATDSTNPTPPPPPEYLAMDYFPPGSTVIARTYDVYEHISDDLGPRDNTAVFSETVMPGDGGPVVVRGEDWVFPDHNEHHDATQSFHVMRDGAVGWDMERADGRGIATSSFFVPVQAMSPDGAPVPPDGKIWLEGTDEQIETSLGDVYTCQRVHFVPGPSGVGVETTFWVAPGVGIVQSERTRKGLTPSGAPFQVTDTVTLRDVTYASLATGYRVRR